MLQLSERGIHTVSRALSWFSGLCVILIMAFVCAEVFARYGFGSTIGGSIEAGELLLAFMVFSGIAYGQQIGAHVSTDIVTSRLPTPVALALKLVGLTLVIAVSIWVCVATLGAALTSYEVGEATFGVAAFPVWPARMFVSIGFALLAIELLLTLLRTWRNRDPNGPPESMLYVSPEGGDDDA